MVPWRRVGLLAVGCLAPALGGCAMLPFGQGAFTDRECMTRVMYFESNRSSEDGMLAVGTTVMNRLESGRYPRSVCGVVGQSGQFADGVLSRSMSRRDSERVARVADRVLAGERHAQVGGAMFFHTAGLTFPYTNMHYVAVAGGNAFYEKRRNAGSAAVQMAGAAPVMPPNRFQEGTQVARSEPAPRPALAPRSIGDLLRSPPSETPGRKVAAVDWSSADPGRY